MSRRAFASSWWGRAWTEALEGRARLDPNRLPRGRTYARQARVSELTVTPGRVTARVQGKRSRPYRVTVRVRMFEPKEWDAALDAIAARAAHAAALLDGELDPGIVDDLAAAGIELLPGPGELGPDCSCPDWADPCKHAAAVCYLVATLLDEDPFAILHLRGRERDAVLASLRSRRANAAPHPSRPRRSHDDQDEGVLARKAFATAGELEPLAPLPDVPLPPTRPHDPAPPVVDLPPPIGATSDLLDLSRDAARRAWELATGQGDGAVSLAPADDLARRAAAALAAKASIDRLARLGGVAPRRLVSLGLAWQAGGVHGVAVLDDEWEPDPENLAEARAALAHEAPRGTRVRVSHNRVGRSDGVQLRLGRDQHWYLFHRRGKTWDLVGTPHVDPSVALQTGGDGERPTPTEQARTASRPGG